MAKIENNSVQIVLTIKVTNILNFIKILVVECIYNMIITIILYPLIQVLGSKLEDVYKGDKILTRYF